MIKIHIPDLVAFKAGYLSIVHDKVVSDLRRLKLSLSHLQDPSSILAQDIVLVKAITKAIVDLIRSLKTPKGFFNKKVYNNAIATYPNNAGSVQPINWRNLINLVNHLLDEVNGDLEKLLIGDPLILKNHHDTLLNQFNIRGAYEIGILKNAFNYGGDPGDSVRQFFYSEEICRFCSYCNMARARHTVNRQTGETADQFHLDHFFSQTDHPMLALSLFNLVPSDSVCNVDNKGKKLFSDEMHLNPYVSGFKRDMVFFPKLDPLGEKVTEIKLKINVDRDSDRWKQLIGDEDQLHVSLLHGNLNIFQIYTKYNCEDLYDQTGKLLKTFLKAAKNERSLKEILNDIETGGNDAYLNFKVWYENNARTCFHENEFGKYAYSKLYRDMLDYVYECYQQDLPDEVGQILTDSYLHEIGGE